MKTILIVSVLIFLQACGGQLFINSDLQPYVEQVQDACIEAGRDDCNLRASIESINFGDTHSKWGYCEVEIDDEMKEFNLPLIRRVNIDEAKWLELDEDQRVWLIAHELGHCQWMQLHAKHGIMHENGHKQIEDIDEAMSTFFGGF